MKATIETIVDSINGCTFASIDTLTDVPLAGGKKNPLQGRVSKASKGAMVMLFSNKQSNGYDNMVKRRLADEGKDPESFQLGKRTWGVRRENSPIVDHNGQTYLEVIFMKPGKSTYMLDGHEVNPSTIEGLKDDEGGKQGGLDNKVIIRTFNTKNIKAISIDKVRYEFK